MKKAQQKKISAKSDEPTIPARTELQDRIQLFYVKTYAARLLVSAVLIFAIVHNGAVFGINEHSTEAELPTTTPSEEPPAVEYSDKRVARSLPDNDDDDDERRGYFKIYIRNVCTSERRALFKELRFPYVQYNRQQFPLSEAWVRVSRQMPLHVDQLTHQTLIDADESVYILPALINAHGKRISVAELLAYGYATMRRTGGLMPFYFSPRHYAHSSLYYMRGAPRFNRNTHAFTDGVHSPFRSAFDPDCGLYYEMEADGQSNSEESESQEPEPRDEIPSDEEHIDPDASSAHEEQGNDEETLSDENDQHIDRSSSNE